MSSWHDKTLKFHCQLAGTPTWLIRSCTTCKSRMTPARGHRSVITSYTTLFKINGNSITSSSYILTCRSLKEKQIHFYLWMVYSNTDWLRQLCTAKSHANFREFWSEGKENQNKAWSNFIWRWKKQNPITIYFGSWDRTSCFYRNQAILELNTQSYFIHSLPSVQTAMEQ